MELDRERARSYVRIQRMIIVSIMVVSTLLIVASLLNWGSLFNGPGSIQLSAILFISLITIMVLASIPTLFIKRRLNEEDDEEVLIWDDDVDDEVCETFRSDDIVKSGCLR